MNTTAAHPSTDAAKALRLPLWIAQAILAVAFTLAGLVKLTTPMAQMVARLPFAAMMPGWLLRLIGVAELAGAVGVVLPALTRVRPGLTPLAAALLSLLMLLAGVYHLSRGELSALPTIVMLGALALFVTWGRTMKVPIEGR